jgi:WXG100 family type VII secretion target
MPAIQVTPENVERTGNDVLQKKAELEESIGQAKKVIDQLRSEFKGNLANQVFGKWDEIQPTFKTTFENVQAAGDILKKAAQAFREVDETKIS